MNEILKRRIEAAANFVTLKLDNGIYKDACKRNFEAGARFALSHQWISVEEALPEPGEYVLVAYGDDEYGSCHRSDDPDVLTDKNGFCNYWDREIIAWMPVPKFLNERKDVKVL